VNFYHILEFDA